MAKASSAKKASTKTAAPKRGPARHPRRVTPKKAAASSKGLVPKDALYTDVPKELAALEERITAVGGVVVGSYRDPLGGYPLSIAILPIDQVEPTPFQRDLSDTHHKRLAIVLEKTARFLDPVIAVTAPAKSAAGFWTPNGRHRLEAMRRLGAKSITALCVAEREVAWQILALNTEKAHNLKERALEVVRIYRGLLEEDGSRAESSFTYYLEDPALVTLGVCYEKNGRFAGGAYHPVLRRLEQFSESPIEDAIAEHESLAALTMEVDEAVNGVIQRLKDRGFVSPYLRSFVVSRINTLRFMKGDLPPAAEFLRGMKARAEKMNIDKVKQEDLARSGGGVPDEE